jgi:hypothetical protein
VPGGCRGPHVQNNTPLIAILTTDGRMINER